ncbi:MAG: C4-type zinc ribbon domain-containing protein [Saprospiraceae bacterium]
MVQTEKPIADKLRELYQLQLIDSKLDELEVLKGELPIEVSDLEDEIVGLETRINRLKGHVDELKSEMSSHDANIDQANSLIVRYEGQMDNVKNNREYEALLKETEMQRLEIQLSNKKINNSRRDLEVKQETLAGTEERLVEKQKNLATKRVELEKIIAKTEKEERKLRKESEKARKLVEDRLIKSYDKVRTNYRNGLAVVTIERNSCGGCFNAIPPQQQLEINQRKKIIACEHCGRVLVDDTILTEADEVDEAVEA